jgi:hypothetical protein
MTTIGIHHRRTKDTGGQGSGVEIRELTFRPLRRLVEPPPVAA